MPSLQIIPQKVNCFNKYKIYQVLNSLILVPTYNNLNLKKSTTYMPWILMVEAKHNLKNTLKSNIVYPVVTSPLFF